MATVGPWERDFYRPNVIEYVEVEGEREKAYTLWLISVDALTLEKILGRLVWVISVNLYFVFV